MQNQSPNGANAIPRQPHEDEISILRVVRFVARNFKTVVLAPILCTMAAVAGSFLIKPQYSALTQIMQPQQQTSASALLGSLSGIAGVLGGSGVPGLKNPADQWIGFLKSNNVVDAIIGKFNLRSRYDVDLQIEARKELEKRSRISSGKDSFIDIEVDDEDPKIAADIANNYVIELQRLTNELAITEASQRRAFFQRELLAAKTNLSRSEIDLRNSGVEPSLLKTMPETALVEVASLRGQITAQEIKIASMKNTYADSSPEINLAVTELRTLQAQLEKSSRIDPLKGQTRNSEYIQTLRDFKYNETLYELLARQYELARVDESRQGSTIQVVDIAQPPERKSKPRRAVIALIALILSTICFAGIASIREWLSTLMDQNAMQGKPRTLRALFSTQR